MMDFFKELFILVKQSPVLCGDVAISKSSYICDKLNFSPVLLGIHRKNTHCSYQCKLKTYF